MNLQWFFKQSVPLESWSIECGLGVCYCLLLRNVHQVLLALVVPFVIAQQVTGSNVTAADGFRDDHDECLCQDDTYSWWPLDQNETTNNSSQEQASDLTPPNFWTSVMTEDSNITDSVRQDRSQQVQMMVMGSEPEIAHAMDEWARKGKGSKKFKAAIKKYFKDYKNWAEKYISYRLHKRIKHRYANHNSIWSRSRHEILCELKKSPIKILTRDVYPFNINPLGKKYLPKDGKVLPGKRFEKCAVVSSTGRLLGSGKGKEIDSYMGTCRLNSAPTKGFEKDVGTKTDVRILNNDVLRYLTPGKDPRHAANYATDGNDVVLFGWDVCPVRGPIHTCLADIDNDNIRKVGDVKDSINPFFKWRQHNMDRNFYFLHPDWMYSLTDFLDKMSSIKLNPSVVPSTGFVGFAIMMHLCSEVHLFEIIPTHVQGKPCKYYFPNAIKKEHNMDCSLFGGHHREMELLTMMKLNVASDEDTYGRGHAVIKGLADLQCP